MLLLAISRTSTWKTCNGTYPHFSELRDRSCFVSSLIQGVLSRRLIVQEL